MMRFLSLGAGVQSTTLALMAAHGEFGDIPDCAIFADTRWEPKAVYDHLQWLASGNVLPFPVHVVTAGDIRDHAVRKANTTGGRFASIPWYTDGGGLVRRQCTKEFKIEPLAKKQRELLGYKARQRIPVDSAEVWIGISTDEAIRMKPARNRWQVNRWPLIEKGMSRWDCRQWLKRHGYPEPPKSACIGCPFHNDAMWRDMRDNDPESFADAIAVDKALRPAGGPTRGMRNREYMHRSCRPLSEVDFDNEEDKGQINFFNNECEGMCGV